MQNALVVGASGGIGGAVCEALAARGVAVTPLSRSADSFDLMQEDAVEQGLRALSGPFDLVFVASGALVIDGHEPEKALSSLEPEALMAQVRLNALGPILVLKHALHLLPKDRRCVFAALSARVGSIGDNGIGGWYSYRSAKAALNQLIRTAAIELRRTHRGAICVALHPGTVATPLTAPYAGRHRTVAPDEAAGRLLAVIDGLTPEQSGSFFDYAGDRIPW